MSISVCHTPSPGDFILFPFVVTNLKQGVNRANLAVISRDMGLGQSHEPALV